MLRKIFLLIRKNKSLLLILFFYISSKFLFSDFIPFWDGGQYYYNCLGIAIKSSFHLSNFNCFGHPSFLYMFLIGLFQYMRPTSIFLFHLPITLLGIASIIAFYAISRFLFPSKTVKNELLLLTALYAFHPVLFSNSLHFNLDYGVLVFYILLTAFLLYKKYKLAFVCGVFLMFSKEPAILMYGATLAVYWVINLRRKNNNNFWILVTPLFLFGTYAFYTRIILHTSFLWSNFGIKRAIEILLIPNLKDHFFIRYMEGIFIFNFSWIYTGFIGVSLGSYVFQRIRNIQLTRFFEMVKLSPTLFIFITFIINLYILTSLKTWLVLRYFLPLYPPLLFLFFASILFLFQSPFIRKFILAICLVLMLLANIYSFDPLTKNLFGEFKFGSHTMYRIGGPEDGIHFGVDGLVYNLQFTAFHYVLNAIYTDLKPNKNTAFIFIEEVADWQFTGYVDEKTFHKSPLSNSSFKIHSYSVEKLLKLSSKPVNAYYIDIPSIKRDVMKTSLKNYYSVSFKKKYSYLGYSFNVYKLILKK